MQGAIMRGVPEEISNVLDEIYRKETSSSAFFLPRCADCCMPE